MTTLSLSMILNPDSNRKLAPFGFVLVVYACWLTIQGPSQAFANFHEQLSIAITMIFGSIVAGGTALGGGAVAFPVMTKVLAIEPSTAKVFSLAIQSIGMTAASITIIFTGIKYYKNIVILALMGAIPGVLFSLAVVADMSPRLLTKSLFSVFLVVFACTLIRLSHQNNPSARKLSQPWLVVATGCCGGIVSGLIGSGADIAIFALLVLYLKRDLKAATATSVIVMAATSVCASAFNQIHLDAFDRQITSYVLAAMPVVVIGAPLGAYLCAKLSIRHLTRALIVLISCEVSFTCYELWLSSPKS